MNIVKKEFLYKELTAEIIQGAFNVHNSLGCGLLEKVYENSLAWELELAKRKVSLQKEFKVIYIPISETVFIGVCILLIKFLNRVHLWLKIKIRF